MQSILYHNSSGNLAFTGKLKRKEVHTAITMHPVKDPKNMYRINAYLKNLKIHNLKELRISLHRDISTATAGLGITPKFIDKYTIAESVPLFPKSLGQFGYLGDTAILGVPLNLNRYHPKELRDVIHWNFISKVIFSTDNANPKRRMEISTIESLEDIIRELMEIINSSSKQRGRVIEFREILYGYQRLDPVHGADCILDVLLVYKKYRGHKMTVSVRRHAYLQQSFTGIEIREVSLESDCFDTVNEDKINTELKAEGDFMYLQKEARSSNILPFLDFKKLNVPLKDVFQSSLMKISKSFPSVFKHNQNNYILKNRIINFILPLSGKYEAFLRFLRNYEEICIEADKRTTLIITIYKDNKYPNDFEKTLLAVNRTTKKFPSSDISVIKIENSQFSRGLSLKKGSELCDDDSLMFFIDVDISFSLESLQRIRWNTIQHHRVYFPIVFSEYDPNVMNGKYFNVIKLNKKIKKDVILANNYIFNDSSNNYGFSEKSDEYYTDNLFNFDNVGYFRQFGFGIASVYKSDFKSIGGFNTEIKGWGLEDVNLFDRFIHSNISIFRTVDSSLIHVFHSVDCDKKLDVAQYDMCIGTRTNTFGSIKHMIVYIFNNPNILLKTRTRNGDSEKPNVVP